LAYIEGGVPILGLSHFVNTHVLREEPDHSISMLYEGGNKVLRLPNQAYFCVPMINQSCSSTHWRTRAIASQDHHAPAGMPDRKQQDRLPLSPSGTLGTGVAF
jgi:hypothetical protein